MPPLMRWDVINKLLERSSSRSYLEIGVAKGACGARVRARKKWGVDPKPALVARRYYHKIFVQTSDAFFRSLPSAVHFDVVFIDGLHHADQVYRDVLNSLRHLNANGTIVLHDCNPLTEDDEAVPRRQSHWNGNCWKAVAELRRVHRGVRAFVINADQGLGVVVKKPGEVPPLRAMTTSAMALKFSDLKKQRTRLLGLVPVERWWSEYAR